MNEREWRSGEGAGHVGLLEAFWLLPGVKWNHRVVLLC